MEWEEHQHAREDNNIGHVHHHPKPAKRIRINPHADRMKEQQKNIDEMLDLMTPVDDFCDWNLEKTKIDLGGAQSNETDVGNAARIRGHETPGTNPIYDWTYHKALIKERIQAMIKSVPRKSDEHTHEKPKGNVQLTIHNCNRIDLLRIVDECAKTKCNKPDKTVYWYESHSCKPHERDEWYKARYGGRDPPVVIYVHAKPGHHFCHEFRVEYMGYHLQLLSKVFSYAVENWKISLAKSIAYAPLQTRGFLEEIEAHLRKTLQMTQMSLWSRAVIGFKPEEAFSAVETCMKNMGYKVDVFKCNYDEKLSAASNIRVWTVQKQPTDDASQEKQRENPNPKTEQEEDPEKSMLQSLAQKNQHVVRMAVTSVYCSQDPKDKNKLQFAAKYEITRACCMHEGDKSRFEFEMADIRHKREAEKETPKLLANAPMVQSSKFFFGLPHSCMRCGCKILQSFQATRKELLDRQLASITGSMRQKSEAACTRILPLREREV
jgi:hypothetical protein